MSRQNRKTSYNYYNQTSEAYDYSLQNKYLPSNKKFRKPRVKRRIEKYVKSEKNIKFYSSSLLSKVFPLLITIIFAMVVILCLEADIIQKRFEVDKLTLQLKEVNENNVNLETKLAENLDLDYIEKIASTNLDMQKPASHQIVYINVEKESYSEKKQNIEKPTLLSRIKDIFSR